MCQFWPLKWIEAAAGVVWKMTEPIIFLNCIYSNVHILSKISKLAWKKCCCTCLGRIILKPFWRLALFEVRKMQFYYCSLFFSGVRNDFCWLLTFNICKSYFSHIFLLWFILLLFAVLRYYLFCLSYNAFTRTDRNIWGNIITVIMS